MGQFWWRNCENFTVLHCVPSQRPLAILPESLKKKKKRLLKLTEKLLCTSSHCWKHCYMPIHLILRTYVIPLSRSGNWDPAFYSSSFPPFHSWWAWDFYLVNKFRLLPWAQERGTLGLHLEKVPRGKGLHHLKAIALDLLIWHPQEVPSSLWAGSLCLPPHPCVIIDLQWKLSSRAEGA